MSITEAQPISPFADLLDLGPGRRRLTVHAGPRYYRRGDAWAPTVEAFRQADAPWVAEATEGVHAARVGRDGTVAASHLGHDLIFRLRGIVALDAAGDEHACEKVALGQWTLDLSRLDLGLVAWEHPATGARYEVRYVADGVHDRLVLTDDLRKAIRNRLPAGAERFGLAFECSMPAGLQRIVGGVEAAELDTELPILLRAATIRQRLTPSHLLDPRAPGDLARGWRERWLYRSGALLQTVPLEALDAVEELRTSVTYQQGVSGYSGCYDAMMCATWHGYVYANWGGRSGAYNYIGQNDGVDWNSAFKFDPLIGASYVPAGSTINSASLQLKISAAPGSATNYGAYMILRDWGEGNGDGLNPPAAGTCSGLYAKYNTLAWTNYACGNNGSDAEAAAQEAISISATGWAAWNVKDSVQDWSNGTSNYGWIIKKPTNNSGNGTLLQWLSSEYATTADRPKLTVDYTAGATGEFDGRGLRRSMPYGLSRGMN